MSEIPPNPPTIDERLERLERTVYWHNVAWATVATIIVLQLLGQLIPPAGAVIGLSLLFLMIAGSVVAFIRLVMWLLDRYFPHVGTKS